MKLNVLCICISIPALSALALYCYSILSTRWSNVNHDLIRQHKRDREKNVPPNGLEYQLVSHSFRSRYGLLGYCLDYEWLDLLTLKGQKQDQQYRYEQDELADNEQQKSTPWCNRMCDPALKCETTGCCFIRCNNIPECPDFSDEKHCLRQHNASKYYWPEKNCIWHQQNIFRLLTSPFNIETSKTNPNYHSIVAHLRHNHYRYIIMVILFCLAALLLCLSLLALVLIKCVDRCVSVPFGLVTLLAFFSFLSGCGGLGLFLYQWIHERMHRPDFAYTDQRDAMKYAFNFWIVNIEYLGLSFWLMIGAVGLSLLTTLLSCCICCGLQSDRSIFKVNAAKKKYEIIQYTPYEDR
ncbi:unnamed protein product [Didymodactylos carnosus]|uniref:Uncharacterized protein n=1 Tax=Didymodactylos carnosus TaxID=1234261 RepID=A0A814AHE3_9BILA|nr:unnamed protein product [Didymodactylos carnosus]CAF0939835.1 unnamed protein product [Didymodactylos carnosus]CAF3693943.1 unnamed protein product [Didymodactylos carnosus]CAF3715142.1 unnamed protein product [Didymodactylos carnosus]